MTNSSLRRPSAAVHGRAVLRPGDDGYDQVCAAWNLEARLRPAAAVVACTAADIRAAVLQAREAGWPIAVMATGHGTAGPTDGALLVNTAAMTGVRVDPQRRTARVEAGARWADLGAAAGPHGLSGLPGSSSQVGVVGYTLGGGFGWLGRRFGFAADSMISAELVTATGDLVRASAEEHPDLFWGLHGGGGNFGIVTTMELALHPLRQVYAGNLYYPVHRAREVLEASAGWHASLPSEMTSATTFRRFPPAAAAPEALRGGSFVAVRGCWSGADPAEGACWVDQARRALGEPVLDTFTVLPVARLDAVSADPVQPIGAHQYSAMLHDLGPAAIDTLVELIPDSPLLMLELRRLGGALSPSADRLDPMGRSDARYTLNAVGPTPTPELVCSVRAFLVHLAEAIRPSTTGTTYVNFLELEGATPERVRAAYSPGDWTRLVALKDRWDPQNLFRCNRNIPPTGGHR